MFLSQSNLSSVCYSNIISSSSSCIKTSRGRTGLSSRSIKNCSSSSISRTSSQFLNRMTNWICRSTSLLVRSPFVWGEGGGACYGCRRVVVLSGSTGITLGHFCPFSGITLGIHAGTNQRCVANSSTCLAMHDEVQRMPTSVLQSPAYA